MFGKMIIQVPQKVKSYLIFNFPTQIQISDFPAWHLISKALNKSVTEFILNSACNAAENALLNQRFFVLDDQGWASFQKALQAPAKAKPGLKKLMQENAPWE